MRSSHKSCLLLAASALGAASLVLSGCGAQVPTTEASDTDPTHGSLGLDLVLGSGATLDSVSYTITGPRGYAKTGAVDVSRSSGFAAVIPGLPAGAGYSITLLGTSADGTTSCSGSGSFDVTAGVTASVAVRLSCREPRRNGGVAVTGTLNLCPVIDGIGASPAEVTVGNSVALTVAAHDSDAGPSPLSFQASAPNGTFTGGTTATPSFTCTVPGRTTVSVTASDGDAACNTVGTVDITCSLPGSGASSVPVTFAVYGDAPYGTAPADTSQTDATPAFIASVNADTAVSGVIHVGDIHSGKQYCTEAYDRQIFQLWGAFRTPLVYTPGDNEWTDCHKTAEGGGSYNKNSGNIDYVVDGNGLPVDYAKGDPLANLTLVRSIFFAEPGKTLGGGNKRVLSQASYFDAAHPTDANYVENVMWQDAGVVFVTLNLPGGSNNDADVWYGAPAASAAQTDEATARTAADLRWLDAAFTQAQATHALGVVIVWQADVWDPEKGASHQTGYEPLVQSVATHTVAFGKPVLMLNGDSHVYQSGNPFSPSDPNNAMHPGYTVPNFHRIVVHGSTTPLEYLRLAVDPSANAAEGPDAYGPFRWTRVLE